MEAHIETDSFLLRRDVKCGTFRPSASVYVPNTMENRILWIVGMAAGDRLVSIFNGQNDVVTSATK